MPAKLDRCVEKVMAQGHSKDSAFAICNASLGEGEWPDGITEAEKERLRPIIFEAMSHEHQGNLVRAAIQSAHSTINMNPPWVYVEKTYDSEVIYTVESPDSEAMMFRRSYSIDESTEDVTLGDPVRVRREISYIPITESMSTRESIVTEVINALKQYFKPEHVSESSPKPTDTPLVESGEQPKLGKLMEKAVRADGTIQLKVIEDGWGSSGYYSKEVLERDGGKAFPAGTQMFWNHATDTEESERPEGDLRNLAAVLRSDPQWQDGAAGPGLYAEAEVFGPYREAVNELAPHIGVSIRGNGTTHVGEAEGRQGPIVDSIDRGLSVDFVTLAGAGGQVVELFESKRGLNIPKNQENDMADDKELKETLDRVAQLEKLYESEKSARVEQQAQAIVMNELRTSGLPEKAITRIGESAHLNPPKTENGELDTDALKTRVSEAVKAETEYLEAVLGYSSPVFGMNSQPKDTEMTDEDVEKRLGESFRKLGLDEETAKIAAAGRR